MSACFVDEISALLWTRCQLVLWTRWWRVMWMRCQPVLWILTSFVNEMPALLWMLVCFVDEVSALFVDDVCFVAKIIMWMLVEHLISRWALSASGGKYFALFSVSSASWQCMDEIMHFVAEMSFCGWKVSLFCLWAAVGQVCRWQVCLFNGWEVSLIYGRNRHGIALFICTDQGGLLIARKTILHPKPGWGPFKYYDMSRDTTTNNYAWYSMCPITKDKNINESFTLSRR